MRAASIQLEVVQGDKQANLDRALEAVAGCADCDLVLLPELWNIGFVDYDAYQTEAETKDGPTLNALCRAAVEAGVFLHTGSFVEKDQGGYYNSSYLLSPAGKILANYRKAHLFGYRSRETAILTPGEKLAVVDTPLAKFGLATCFDLRFPEMFRAMADRGAQVFLVCSAWPLARLDHWLLFNRVRALENQCFLISANSAGDQMGQSYAGNGMMVNPEGLVLAKAGRGQGAIKAEIDPAQVAGVRGAFPSFASRVDWLR